MSRLDSVTLRTAANLLARAQDARISVDSALRPLSVFVHSGTGATSLTVSTVSALLDTSTVPATLDVDVIATNAEAPRETRQWSSTERIELLPEDRRVIETHRLLFVTLKEPPRDGGSLWADVLQPVLVVLGAGAIVALFFLIRS